MATSLLHNIQTIILKINTAHITDSRIRLVAFRTFIDFGNGVCENFDDVLQGKEIAFPYKDRNTEYTVKIESANIMSLVIDNLGITEIQFYNCINLYFLSCNFNQLKKIDVSECKELEIFACSDNQLTEIKLKDMQFLNTLSCAGNKLQCLSLTRLPLLERLNCQENQLTQIEIIECERILRIDCCKNPLTKNTIIDNIPIQKPIRYVHYILLSDFSNDSDFREQITPKGWEIY